MPHISERAEKFAKKFVKDKPKPDMRTDDEKMANLRGRWSTLAEARKRVKEASDASK